MSDALKNTRDALDKQLLGLVVAQPRRILVLAIATGMAIAQELVARRMQGDLDLIGRSDEACGRACDVVLEHWARAARAGDINEAAFQRIVDEIVLAARAS